MALWRQARPPTAAQQRLQDAYSDMQNRRSPFDGSPIRVLPGVITITNVLQVAGSKPGMASADVLYASSIGIDADQSLMSLSDKEKLAPGSVRILEHAVGADVAMSAPAPDLESEIDSRMEQYRQAAISRDFVFGPDLRGRTYSEDVTDYIIAVYRKRMQSPAVASKEPAKLTEGEDNFATLGADLAARAQALQDYWKIAPGMMHNRDLWQSFLERNGMAATTPHETNVLAAEAALPRSSQAMIPTPDGRSSLPPCVMHTSRGARPTGDPPPRHPLDTLTAAKHPLYASRTPDIRPGSADTIQHGLTHRVLSRGNTSLRGSRDGDGQDTHRYQRLRDRIGSNRVLRIRRPRPSRLANGGDPVVFAGGTRRACGFLCRE